MTPALKERDKDPKWLPEGTAVVVWTDKEGRRRVTLKRFEQGVLRPPEERDRRGMKQPKRD